MAQGLPVAGKGRGEAAAMVAVPRGGATVPTGVAVVGTGCWTGEEGIHILTQEDLIAYFYHCCSTLLHHGTPFENH